MAKLSITPEQRKALRAEAHDLNPVVMIGADGLSDAVRKETDAALNAHGLIKIRVHGDDRAAREAIWQDLAESLGAAPVQHIGKLLVLWRPRPEKEKNPEADAERKPGPRQVKIVKYSSRGGQRPSVRVRQVMGNERVTAGGNIKRAKPKQKSVKKGRAD